MLLNKNEWEILERFTLESIADSLKLVIDEKKAIRTNDIGREKVYKTHLGKRLR